MKEHCNRQSCSRFLFAIVLVAAQPMSFAASPALPPAFDDLVKVRSRQMDAVYVLPGADFRAYAKVMIDPVDVSFRRGWIEAMNRTRGAARRRIDEKDAEYIAGAMRSGFNDVFAAAFRTAGYEVVSGAGTDVLRLYPAIANLYINAPAAAASGTARSYTVEAGEATLTLEARDLTTGALLGLAFDRRQTRSVAGLAYTTSVTNRAAFEDLFRRWANICAKGLTALKSSAAN